MFPSLRNPTWGLLKEGKVAELLRGNASGDRSADRGSDGSRQDFAKEGSTHKENTCLRHRVFGQGAANHQKMEETA